METWDLTQLFYSIKAFKICDLDISGPLEIKSNV